MRHTNYHLLVDRGRKAGLKTGELYHALATRPPEAGDHLLGAADGNGFVPAYDHQGQRIYRPAGARGQA